MQNNSNKINRRFQGIVVSNKMNKTIIVEIERIKQHAKYKKRYKVNKRFKVHNEKQEVKIGDNVIFEECRPLSKEKRWKMVEIIK